MDNQADNQGGKGKGSSLLSSVVNETNANPSGALSRKIYDISKMRYNGNNSGADNEVSKITNKWVTKGVLDAPQPLNPKNVILEKGGAKHDSGGWYVGTGMGKHYVLSSNKNLTNKNLTNKNLTNKNLTNKNKNLTKLSTHLKH